MKFGQFAARSVRAIAITGLSATLLTACLNQTKSGSPGQASPGQASPPAGSAPRPSQIIGGAAGSGAAGSAAQAFAQCPQFFANGQPPAVAVKTPLRALCYDAFAILHNGSTRTPFYVAERLNQASIADADEKRTNKFFSDARLPKAERSELSDYKGSGYSRGHMAPAANMPTAQAMAQSFSLANMVPQSSKQNGGPWARIEKDTRSYASRAAGDVFVITGPVFDAQPATIGGNRVAVPSYLYKLVYDASTGRAWAHWQANRDDTRNSKPITYQELVKNTGIDFLPGIQPKN